MRFAAVILAAVLALSSCSAIRSAPYAQRSLDSIVKVEGGGLCAGIVLSATKVVTNKHCTDGYKTFTVTTRDGRVLLGTVIGESTEIDVAVVRVPGLALAPATFADSARVLVGDWVYAIGHPRGLDWSLVDGVVSALARKVESFVGVYIQHSAPIHPGNSGGALFNAAGEVIGMNTLTGPSALGFAISSNDIIAAVLAIEAADALANPR